MAALTNSRNTPEMADGGSMRVLHVEANTNVYLGGMVAMNAAGNAVPASATTTICQRAEGDRARRIRRQRNSRAERGQQSRRGRRDSITARKGVFMYAQDGSVTAASVGLVRASRSTTTT